VGESEYHKLQKPQDRDPHQLSFWENTAVVVVYCIKCVKERSVWPMGR